MLRCRTLLAIALTALPLVHAETWEFRSPDGQHIVLIRPREVWLRHATASGVVRLRELGDSAELQWSADSRYFLLVDREGSDSILSFLYDNQGRLQLDFKDALRKGDPELAAVATGHFYVVAQRWLDPDTVRAVAFGHTDQPPVRCFRFVYTVTHNGNVMRLSKRISPATRTECDEESEQD